MLSNDLQHELYSYSFETAEKKELEELEKCLSDYPIASKRLKKLKEERLERSKNETVTSSISDAKRNRIMDDQIVYKIAQAVITPSNVIDVMIHKYAQSTAFAIKKYLSNEFKVNRDTVGEIVRYIGNTNFLFPMLAKSGYFVNQTNKESVAPITASSIGVPVTPIADNSISILWTNNKIDSFLNQWGDLAEKNFLYSPKQSACIFPNSINDKRRHEHNFTRQLEKCEENISEKRTVGICPQAFIVTYASPNDEKSIYSLLATTKQIYQAFFERYMTPLIGEVAFYTNIGRAENLPEDEDVPFKPLGESAVKQEIELMDDILKDQGPFADFLKKELINSQLKNVNIIDQIYWKQLLSEITHYLDTFNSSASISPYNCKTVPFLLDRYAVPVLEYTLNTQTKNVVLPNVPSCSSKKIQYVSDDPENAYASVTRDFVTIDTQYDGSCLYRALDTYSRSSNNSSSQQKDNNEPGDWTLRSQSAQFDMQSMIWQLTDLKGAIQSSETASTDPCASKIIEMIYPEAFATSQDQRYIKRINNLEANGHPQASWQTLQKLIKEYVNTAVPIVTTKEKQEIVSSYLDMLINFAINVKQDENYCYLCRDVSHVFLKNNKTGIPIALAFLNGFNLTILKEEGNTYKTIVHYTAPRRETNETTIYILFTPTGANNSGLFQRLKLEKESISDEIVVEEEEY